MCLNFADGFAEGRTLERRIRRRTMNFMDEHTDTETDGETDTDDETLPYPPVCDNDAETEPMPSSLHEESSDEDLAPPAVRRRTHFQILVRAPQQTVMAVCFMDDTVATLKTELFISTRFAPVDQIIVYNNVQLDNNAALVAYGIDHGSVLSMTSRLHGGVQALDTDAENLLMVLGPVGRRMLKQGHHVSAGGSVSSSSVGTVGEDVDLPDLGVLNITDGPVAQAVAPDIVALRGEKRSHDDAMGQGLRIQSCSLIRDLKRLTKNGPTFQLTNLPIYKFVN